MKTSVWMEYQNAAPALQRKLKPSIREGLKASTEFWHRWYLKGHFKQSAMSRYRYRRRTQKYNDFKKKKYGHTKPLVLTGDMERQMRRSRTVRGTSKRASVTMSAPNYIHRSQANQPNKKLEVLTLLKYEEDVLVRVVEKRIEKGIKSVEIKRKRRLA